ncbi:hypothetical protein N431DRAFT_456199 [Stipitochalara longipes BDJ]|nr:hypothetical protein N431DRAFT_456199 [Stipitochalara longipes BDJ]
MALSKEIDVSECPKPLQTKVSSTGSEKKAGGTFVSKLFNKSSRGKSLDEKLPGTGDNRPSAGNHPPAHFVRLMHPQNNSERLQPRICSQEGFKRDDYLEADTASESGSSSVMHPITKARLRADTYRILVSGDVKEAEATPTEGNIRDEAVEPAEEYFDNGFHMTSKTDHFGYECSDLAAPQYDEISEMGSHQSSGALQISQVATKNSRNGSEFDHWKFWLECYTTGQYNLSNPPIPTPPAQCHDTFDHLPAVHTFNEEERISLCTMYDTVWAPGAHTDALGELVSAAVKRFGAEAGCLSFFNTEKELVQIEGLHQRPRIDRQDSIAAHALYSQEVMVVLDTKKDWRFERNPLVIGGPRIRFFAGAPLLSDEGVAMGVLSLIERKPRSAFTPKERGEFAEFSKKIVQELNYIVDTLTDPALRTTPLLDRESIINGHYKPYHTGSSDRMFSTEKVVPELMPSGLQYQLKPSKPSMNTRYPINTHMNFSYAGEPTPPPSAESNTNSWFDQPQSYGKNYEQLCEDPVLHEGQAFGQQANSGYRCSSPRPFSSSDLTSLHPPPFNSPDNSFEGADSVRQADFDLSDQQFYELTDADCAEDMAPSLPANTSLGTQSIVSFSSSRAELPQQKPGPIIEQNIKDFAEQCNFDVVYCVELTLKPSPIGNELTKKFLILYGQKKVAELNSDLHLQVLQSGDCMHLQGDQENYERDAFADGFLIPLHAEAARKHRSAGIVLGMFRKARTIEKYGQRNSQQERQLVIAFASKLSRIIPPKSSSSRKHSHTDVLSHNSEPRLTTERSYTEPIASRPFLANEATEVMLDDENVRLDGVWKPFEDAMNLERAHQKDSTAKHVPMYPSGQAHFRERNTGAEGGNTYPRPMEVVQPKHKNNNFTERIKGLGRRITADALSNLGSGGFA